MTWIGIDDTDSPRGGCTTFAMTEVVRAVRGAGFDLLGEPRLVRLNPNVPFKTRGNAALSVRVGRGRGPSRLAGHLPDGPVRVFGEGDPLTPAQDRALFGTVWAAVAGAARLGEAGTDPALVMSRRRLPAALYWQAVQRLVPLEDVERLLAGAGALLRTEGSRQGLVGAAAAIAWPGGHPTWEMLAYRRADRWGRKRIVDAPSVARLARDHAELFLCHDPTTRRTLVVPHTACPILFGLRATRPERLPTMLRRVRSEPVERWTIFRTNQASGDHLSRVPASEIPPYGSSVLVGEVGSIPISVSGGHVRFPFVDADGTALTCVAFEPTKTLPRVAASLWPGDRIRVWGGRGADRSFRLEGIELLRPVVRSMPGPRPSCPVCGRRMESLGRQRGFRCRRDGTRAPPEARSQVTAAAAPAVGRHHPTPSARRHLHPLAPEPGRLLSTKVPWWRRRPIIDLYR